ncbi:hypothetical protein K439DRAFT_1332364 [Ramaria rubella]|nr:hypothetical protein K439DRAFT_1332364 [Ramaria rubella]
MSTVSTTLRSFFVYAPDYTDEGALERRRNVRTQHLAAAKGLHDTGVINIGGAFLSPDGFDVADPTSKMAGSMLVVNAVNVAEVRKLIEADIYWTSGVWDKERLSIYPFLTAPLK